VTTACQYGTTPAVLVVPCDLVGLSADALKRLIAALPVGGHDGPSSPLADATGAVIARIAGRVHPLLGVYPRALGVRAASLAAQGAPARVFAEGATVVDLSDLALSDANTWADRGGVHPLVALQRRPGVGPAAVASEVARLRARGCLLPPLPPPAGLE